MMNSAVSFDADQPPPPPAEWPPTFAGFRQFVREVVGIPELYLPDGSTSMNWAWFLANDTVLWRFRFVPNYQPGPMQQIYSFMVYCLASHNLFMWAQDVQPPPDPPFKLDANGNPIGFFAYYRQLYGLNAFSPGIVETAYDQGTGTGLVIPDAMKQLTPDQLQLMKTPWGRAYLNYAMAWNRPWGIT